MSAKSARTVSESKTRANLNGDLPLLEDGLKSTSYGINSIPTPHFPPPIPVPRSCLQTSYSAQALEEEDDIDDFGTFDLRCDRVVVPKSFDSSMHLSLGFPSPVSYTDALLPSSEQLRRYELLSTLPMPVPPSVKDVNDFIFGDFVFHVHSRVSKVVNLSLIKLVLPEVSFSPLTTTPTLHERQDDVNYLATLLLRFRRGFIHVARSKTAIVSRRPLSHPLSSVDAIVASICQHDVEDQCLFLEARLPILCSHPVSVPGLISSFPIPMLGPGYVSDHFPTVPGLANFCSVCGDVTVCSHLFDDILEQLPPLSPNLSVLVQYLFTNLREHRHYSSAIPIFSFHNPYTRHAYALAMRAILPSTAPASIRSVVERWVMIEDSVCNSLYCSNYEAQSVTDLLARTRDISAVVFDYIKAAPAAGFSFLVEYCTRFFQFLTSRIIEGVSYLIFNAIQGFVSSLFANVKNASQAVLDTILRYQSVLCLFFKIIVRYVFDYSITAHMFELSVDPVTQTTIARLYSSGIEAQGSDIYAGLLGIIFSGLCALLSFSPCTHAASRLITSALTNMSLWNRSGFWDKMQSLFSLLNGSPDMALLESYNDGVTKDSVAFYNLYVHVNDPSVVRSNKLDRALGHYYYLHLKALPKMSVSERRYIENICKPAVNFVIGAGIQQLQDYRRVPDVFCFFGEAGLGKSDLLRHFAQQAIFFEHHSLDIQDFAYTVSASDAFSSGYNRQSMWIMDELYPSKDGTTASTQAPCIPLLLQLCTPSPQALNMASLADKGMLLNCSIVLTSCNLNMAGSDPLIHQTKSMTYPAAFSERVSYRIRPALQDGYSISNRRIVGRNGLPIVYTHPRDLYTFEVYDAKGARRSRSLMGFPSGDDDFSNLSYSELMILIVSSYSSGENFVAPKFTGCLDDDIASSIRDRVALDRYRYNPSSMPSLPVPAVPSESSPVLLPFGDIDTPIVTPKFTSSSSSSLVSSVSLSPKEKEQQYDSEGLWDYFRTDPNKVPHYFTIDSVTQVREAIPDVLYEFSPSDLDDVRETPSPYAEQCSECVAYTIARGYLEKVYVRRLSQLSGVNLAAAAFSLLTLVFGTGYYFLRDSTPVSTDTISDFPAPTDSSPSEAQAAPARPSKYSVIPNSLWNKPIRDNFYSSQGEPSPWILASNPRGDVVFQKTLKNLFALFSGGDIFLCNVFALDSTTLAGPNHILRNLKSFSIRGERNDLPVSYSFREDQFSQLDPIDTSDIGVLRLNTHLLSVRNICNSLQRNSNCSGEVVRVFRNADNEVQIMRMYATVPDSYANYSHRGENVRLAPSDHRLCESPNQAGLCGSIYIALRSQERETVTGGPIFGIHVAGKPASNVSVFSIISRDMFTNITPDSCYRGNDAGGKGPVASSGISTSSTLNRLPTISKASLGIVPMPTDGLSAPSLLFPAVSCGVDLLPTNHYISMINAPIPPDLPDLYPSGVKLINKLLTYGEPVPEEATTIAAVVGGFGPNNSLDRSASAGYPHSLGGVYLKGDYCLKDKESSSLELPHVISPKPELAEIVLNLETALQEGRIFDSVATVALKEEPVTVAKVLIGKTRVYSVVPIHEVILAKRWFLRGLTTVASGPDAGSGMFDLDSLGKQVHDAFLARIEADAIVKFGRGKYVIKVLAQDYQNFDISFNLALKRFIGFVARSVERGSPLSRKEIDYPVTTRDQIRHKVWARTAEFRAHFASEEYDGIGHPSGGTLTSYINYLAQQLTLTDAFAATNPEALWLELLMGDDSLVFIAYAVSTGFDLNSFVAHEKSLGFRPVNDAKTGPPELMSPYRGETDFSEYTFCSHAFTKTGCVLTVPRLNRILPFQKRGKESQGLTGCLSAIQNYLKPYHADNLQSYLTLIYQQLAYCGFSDPEKFLLLSPSDLARDFNCYFFSNPQKFVAKVPAYNLPSLLPVDLDEHFASQGVDEDPHGVSFVDDAGLELVTIPAQPPFYEAHLPSHELSEPYRFERPFQIDSFKTGLTFTARIYPTLSSYFKNNFFAQLAIFNRAYLHATVVYRFIVSGSPLTTGQIICSSHYTNYIPEASTDYEAAGSEHVILDLPSCRQAEIRCPMLLPNNVGLINAVSTFNSYVQYFDFGNIRVHNLTPISEDISVTIFAWLEDVKLRGACLSTWTLPAPTVPVTSSDFSMSYYDAQGKDTKSSKPSSAPSADAIKASSKARMDEKRMDWQMEHTPGWVATTEATVASAGHMVEGVASSILGPLGEFAGDAGAAAPALLGFSAPPMDTHPIVVTPLNNALSANVIGEVPSVVLGASQCTHVVRPPGLFGTDDDEMLVYNMVKQWQLLYVSSWDPSTPPGIRWQYPVMPGLYHTSSNPATYPQVANPTRLAHLTTMFRYWRGGLKFKIVLSKTALHTGLLEIEYQTGHGTVRSTGKQSGALPRVLWDISKSNSIEVVIPYNSWSSWTPCISWPFLGPDVPSGFSYSTGRLQLNIINPITDSSGTVSGPVPMVWWIAGCPDFEFTLPTIYDTIVYKTSFTTNLINDKGKEELIEDEYESQGKDDDLFPGSGLSLNTEMISANPSDEYSHLSTVGERWINTRLLIKRSPPSEANFAVDSAVPFGRYIPFSDLSPTNKMFRTLACLYNFYSGGFRLRVRPQAGNDDLVIIHAVHDGGSSDTWRNNIFAPARIFSGRDLVPYFVDIPYTSQLPFQPLRRNASTYVPRTGILLKAKPDLQVFFSFSTMDDFSFGGLTGAPPFTISTKPTSLPS